LKLELFLKIQKIESSFLDFKFEIKIQKVKSSLLNSGLFSIDRKLKSLPMDFKLYENWKI